ncbi:hypothetical protein [Streptomyces dysideae]|uniref:Uncharacterized protein n=1 Tax=Streptomyces dysideae TaxID=909626 RepID=A0A117RXC4_9ACTN|nr:hypothetical protein [Streptomyces dysideae]KUO14767.1 hypothetical protein AQJ91_44980 [Streptomyces dysideae]
MAEAMVTVATAAAMGRRTAVPGLTMSAPLSSPHVLAMAQDVAAGALREEREKRQAKPIRRR